MLKDRTWVWVLEYIFGGALVLLPLASLVLGRSAWTDAHIWATRLATACLGVILISCASSMRQRMLLSKRIDTLAKQIADSPTESSQGTAENASRTDDSR